MEIKLSQFWTWLIALSLSLILISGAQAAPKAELIPRWQAFDPASTIQIDHHKLDIFLEKHRKTGPKGVARIAYKRVTPADKALLGSYLDDLQSAPVSKLNKPEQLAYWVNLYNAATLSLILTHKPEDSIREINISPGFFTIGPWGKQFLTVEGQALSLDMIEHGILRPIWKDPRLHYVLNCASIGCPDIPEKALNPENLDAQLDRAATIFIDHPRAIKIDDDGTAIVSSIYSWFGQDFGTNDKDILNHIRRYASPSKRDLLKSVTKISDDQYNWSLNGLAD